MKDDFNIIDLDLTDHIPQVEKTLTEDNHTTVNNTEEYIDEDYAEEEVADEEYYEAEEEVTDEEYYEAEEEVADEEHYEAEEEVADEEYYEAEEEVTDEEYYEEDPYYGIDEENAGDEIFQGEVSVDTIIMNGIADAVEGADAITRTEDSSFLNEEESERLRQDVDAALQDQYTDSIDFVDVEEMSAADEEFEEEYEEEPLIRRSSKKKKKKEGFPAVIISFFKKLTVGDWMIAGTGVVIICMAVVTLFFWGKARNIDQQVTNMYDLGYGLSNIGVAGESGLLAVADARMNAVSFEEEPQDSTGGVTVDITFTSVEKDMKIKFINADTDRLITDVVFEITLTSEDGDAYEFKDEDLDGIIYEKNMEPGDYSVTVEPIDGYTFADYSQSVTVKDEIAYEQIDVTQEIKSESEVNVAVEDTAVNNAEAEAEAEAVPTLADTVEWVESTRTAADGSTGYQQVDKSTIPEPSYASRNVIEVANEGYAVSGRIANPMEHEVMVLTREREITESTTPETSEAPSTQTTSEEPSTQTTSPSTEPSTEPSTTPSTPPSTTPSTAPTGKTVTITVNGENSVKVGSTLQLTPTIKDGNTTITGGTTSYTSKDTATATVDSNGKVTGVKAGTVVITISYTKTDGSTTYTGSHDVTITVTAAGATVSTLTLNHTTLAVVVGGNSTIAPTATLSDGTKVTTASSFTFTPDKTTIATVDATGKITGVAKGTAVITVTYKDSSNNTKTATCTVTVSDATVSTVSLNKATTTIAKGDTETLVATALMTNNTKITDASKFTWTSQTTSVATVDSNGKITAVGVGTAKITVSYKDALGNTKSASCTVTVVANPAQDTSSKLKDKDDNQIYVNSNGEYVEATYADYYNASAFYLKTDVQYRYTGWQTINGNVYFFDKNGNKVTGEQVIQGVKYNFTSEGILAMNNNGVIGIDVSKWNGSIDWNAVKNSGISYVIIRCGYRGSSTGVLVEDPKFKTNIQGATAAGLKVGVYFFTQAVNEVEAVEEASMVLSLVKGYGVSYPIFIDTERANGRADGLDRNTRTAVCRAFCETIRNAGYSAGVYASKSWFNDNLNYSSLSGYKIWLAQYASAPTFANRYDMWQNSDKGSVSGISGKVDMNISYLGY